MNSKTIDVEITDEHIQKIFNKNSNFTETVIVILSTLKPSQFTTARWIESILLKCNIEPKMGKVAACVTILSGRQECVENIEYDEGKNPVDLQVVQKPRRGGSTRPNKMCRLSKKGKKRLETIIKDNSECFKD